jgi:polyglycine hydrolase-like protein
MAYITTGLTNGGVTTHYKFSYDSALGGPGGSEPARTNAVIAACESDYNLMKGWFGGSVNVTGMSVQVTTQSNGASWSGSASSSTIQLKAQGASYSNNPAYLRYLLIAEVVEIFMMAQGIGWFQGSNEGSKGEGLSRFLSGQFLAQNGFLGLGIDANYAVADLWLNSSRQDFVNTAPADNGYDATNGCTTLFIYYLFSQLGYTINQIVKAGASTLAGVYKNLTGDSANPFPLFKAILDLWLPSTSSSAVPGPNFDDPFPLLPAAYTGVWRSGSGPYYLWTDANQSSFLSKWQTLGSQNMRLTDIEVTMVNGQALFSGLWDQGSDAYYLWINADKNSFISKWQALAAQNLRLISIKHYNGLWAGVWRQGSDGYYLWIDADQNSFLSKWQALGAQNLRLVDFDVYTVNGQTLWAGVWRQGSDGYYLWINADWASFTAKWSQLAAQNLRLVGVREYNGLWAGIWRSGSDGYYLWANVSESNFLSKWQQLAGQNLRLVDLIAVPLNKSGVPSGALAHEGGGAGATGERIASSEMIGRIFTAADAPRVRHEAAMAESGGHLSRTAGAGGGSASGASGPTEYVRSSGTGVGGGSVSETAVGSPGAITGTGGGSTEEALSPAEGIGGGAALAVQSSGTGQGGGEVTVAADGDEAATGAGHDRGERLALGAASEPTGSSEMRGRGA